MKKLLLPAVISLIVFAACNKPGDVPAPSITKEGVLGTYKVTGLTIKTGSVPFDGMATFSDCQLDDLYTFKADNQFQYTDAGATCEPKGDFNDEWSLKGDSIFYAGHSEKIISLTATTLQTEHSVPGIDVPTVTTATFTKQ